MHPGRIKLRHLQALVAVAQHRHLTRAAQALAVTQPAVSKTLMELEEILGVQLLQRSPRGVSLTLPGELLVRHAGTALRAVREGLDALGALDAQAAPVLALGLLPTAAAKVFPAAVTRYRESFPHGRLQVLTTGYSEMLSRLKRGELDLVLGRQAETEEMTGLTFEPLYSEPMVLVAGPGHPLLRGRRQDALRQLGDHTLLLPTEGSVIRRTADAFLLGRGVEAPATVETMSATFARALVLASDAVWFVPLGIVEPDLRAGSLARLPVDTASTVAAVGLTLQAGATLSAAAEAMVRAIRSVTQGQAARAAPPARAGRRRTGRSGP